MMVFTIWLSGMIPANYQACIDSQNCYYPQMVIIRDWGNCPIERTGNDRRDSEKLRRWILSQHGEALYFDADLFLNQELTFDKTDKPWFGADDKGVDEWLIYHKGQQEFFKNLPYVISTGNSYQIKGDFLHHGYTMNGIA